MEPLVANILGAKSVFNFNIEAVQKNCIRISEDKKIEVIGVTVPQIIGGKSRSAGKVKISEFHFARHKTDDFFLFRG